METPRNMDAFLQSVLQGKPTQCGRLSEDDHAFARGMLDRLDAGSRGVFVVINPDETMDYMVANQSYTQAIGMLARLIMRTARRVEEEGGA